ncbi:hypothetical protein EYF80_036848 [Liparis tanakae]|uniref:Uncharacterized protein n=1 Tax=Liparis tanakae TaxID=230148 RepID=A0A4Z2GHW4_9TELE|nr:hypothetical protein EYF80_036848 [Liparis tanakae]
MTSVKVVSTSTDMYSCTIYRRAACSFRGMDIRLTSLVHKVCFPGDGVPPLVKPQRLVAFVFFPCGKKHSFWSGLRRLSVSPTPSSCSLRVSASAEK